MDRFEDFTGIESETVIVTDVLDVTFSVADGLSQVPFALEAQFAPDSGIEFREAACPH